jgi:hypothetical protein
MLELLRAAPEAMRRVKTARFVAIRSTDPRAPSEQDPDLLAIGVTDFGRYLTRAHRCRMGSDAELEAHAAARTINPVARAGMIWAAALMSTEFDAYFVDGAWCKHREAGWECAPAAGNGRRSFLDPVLPLEYLAGSVEILDSRDGGLVGGVPTRRVEARSDARLMEDHLDDNVPVVAWIDGDGLARRVSVANREHPKKNEPFWSTVEFVEFGAQLEAPDVVVPERAGESPPRPPRLRRLLTLPYRVLVAIVLIVGTLAWWTWSTAPAPKRLIALGLIALAAVGAGLLATGSSKTQPPPETPSVVSIVERGDCFALTGHPAVCGSGGVPQMRAVSCTPLTTAETQAVFSARGDSEHALDGLTRVAAIAQRRHLCLHFRAATDR